MGQKRGNNENHPLNEKEWRMSDSKVYEVPEEYASRAYIDNDKYLALYERSISESDYR